MDHDNDFYQGNPPTQTPTLRSVPYIDNDVTMNEWLVTLLLSAIPFVNIILLFVWAFDSATKPSKANWAKATLIFVAVSIVLAIIVAMTFGNMANSILGGSQNPSFY